MMKIKEGDYVIIPHLYGINDVFGVVEYDCIAKHPTSMLVVVIDKRFVNRFGTNRYSTLMPTCHLKKISKKEAAARMI